jgi:hypothetical protein
MQALHKDCGVFCPKDNTVYASGIKLKMGNLPVVHGVPDRQFAAAQAFHQPFAKESGNIGPSARGKYQNRPPFAKLVQ